MARRPRDSRLIDALGEEPGTIVDQIVWRIAREGRDPTACSASGGRWDDTSFAVLYTSRTDEGALAEMFFHLSEGQPIIPSKVRFSLHEVYVRLERALDLTKEGALSDLGFDVSRFGSLSYFERREEYPRTQEIAEVAHFHGFDGLIVPSARSEAENVVVFCDEVGPDQLRVIRDHGVVDWKAYASGRR